MSYRGSKGWRPNSRRNRRGRRPVRSESRGSDRTLILVLGAFLLAVVALLALIVYNLG